MRSPLFQFRMSLLALLAVLLLVLVPTVGRVLSAASDASSGVWAQMCTVAGLKLVKLAPAGDAHPLTPKPSPTPMGGDGMQDCAYCPLLNAMAVLVLWVVFALPPVRAAIVAWWQAPARRSRWHPCGLGSRGPPLAA